MLFVVKKINAKVKNILDDVNIAIRFKAPKELKLRFQENLKNCDWNPHPEHSVFTQYDQDYYLQRKEEFLHKYKCFYAIAKTVSPQKIIELGTHAGSGADAYTSGQPNAEYIGIDMFGEGVHSKTGLPWRPYEVATQLLTARGVKAFRLIRANLRELTVLPEQSDFVVVDAAHDFDNEYADLQLALTANPTYIFVDDADDVHQAKPAIDKFLTEDLKDRVEFIFPIQYIGGGLLIKLKLY